MDSNIEKAYSSFFSYKMNEFERMDVKKSLDSLHKAHLSQLKGKKFIIKVSMKLSEYDFQSKSFSLNYEIGEDNRDATELSNVFGSKKRKYRDAYFHGSSIGNDERWVLSYNKRPSRNFRKALKSKNLKIPIKVADESKARQIAEWRSLTNYFQWTKEETFNHGYYISGSLKPGRMRILGSNKVVLVPEQIILIDKNQDILLKLSYPK